MRLARAMQPFRIFLLSPAHCAGRRAETLCRPEARFDLAARVRSPSGAPLAEVFSFLSGLYFRGKIAYAGRFERPPPGAPGALVISSGRGLLSPALPVALDDLREFAEIPIDLRDPRYTVPLARDLEKLSTSLTPGTEVVLLGSIATDKYLSLLLDAFGPRLLFPQAFVGIGDMSRGAIMLRAAAAGEELPYIAAEGAVRSLAARPSLSR